MSHPKNRPVAFAVVFLAGVLATASLVGAAGPSAPSAAARGPEDTEFLVLRRVAEDFAQGLASGVALDQDQLVLKPTDNGILTPYGEFQSPEVELPFHVNALLLSFVGKQMGDSVMGVWIKVVDVKGQPSRWLRIERETEIVSAEPIRSYRYRILLVADAGKSPAFEAISIYGEHVLAPVPTVGLYGASPSRPRAAATTSPPPAALPEAPPIVERPSWGALPPKEAYTLHTPEWLVVHHTVAPTTTTYQGAASMRGIQNAHFGRGWIDIGYHFVVGPDGTIFRGRPANVSGAHTIPNPGKVGISVIGNFQEEAVPPEAREALVKLLAWLCGDLGLPAAKVKAHKDFASTLCPGNALYDEMPAIRTAVEALLDPPPRR